MPKNLRITTAWTLLAFIALTGFLFAAAQGLSQEDQDPGYQDSAAVAEWAILPVPSRADHRQAKAEFFPPSSCPSLRTQKVARLSLELPPSVGKDLLTFIHLSRT